MKYHELNATSNKQKRRVGRGISAGQGKTAGRGTKGQKSRTGYSLRPGFEGGQNPLSQRFPKLRGFTSHRIKADTVYLDDLSSLGANVDNFTLAEAGLVANPHTRVKVLNRGEYNKKQKIQLQAASKQAIAAIEKAGGSFVTTNQIGRTKAKERDNAKAEK